MSHRGWLLCCVFRAWRRISDNRRSAAIAIIAIAVLLFLVGATKIADNNVNAAAQRWGRGIHMVVYLESHVTAAQGADLTATLGRLDAVAKARYLSREKTLDFLQSDGVIGDSAAHVDPELIPASIELELMPGVENLAAANPVVERLGENPLIADVEFLGDWVGQLTNLAHRGTSGTRAALWVVLVFAAFVVAALVRSRASERSDEEKVLDLLGVTAVGRRLLVGIEGAMLGVAAAGLASALLWLAFSWCRGFFQVAIDPLADSLALEFLGAGEVAALIGFAALAGLGAGLIPTRSHGLR